MCCGGGLTDCTAFQSTCLGHSTDLADSMQICAGAIGASWGCCTSWRQRQPPSSSTGSPHICVCVCVTLRVLPCSGGCGAGCLCRLLPLASHPYRQPQHLLAHQVRYSTAPAWLARGVCESIGWGSKQLASQNRFDQASSAACLLLPLPLPLLLLLCTGPAGRSWGAVFPSTSPPPTPK